MGTKNIEVSDEAYSSLNGLKTADESLSEAIIRMGSKSHASLIRRVCFVISCYGFAVWLYVIAYQLSFPQGVYGPFALWLPIRMDYVGEAAFTLSFISALITAAYRPHER